MTEQPKLIIRDALATDIPRCFVMNHDYETDHVWQVSIQHEDNQHQIHLREERLPRVMTVTQKPHPRRLNAALEPDQCFLVAAASDNSDIYGYLVMTHAYDSHMATVRDVVVDMDYRRHGIASRLLRVAKKWAVQRDLISIHAETHTKNYPAVQLYQRNGYNFCGFNDQYFLNQDIAIFFCQQTR